MRSRLLCSPGTRLIAQPPALKLTLRPARSKLGPHQRPQSSVQFVLSRDSQSMKRPSTKVSVCHSSLRTARNSLSNSPLKTLILEGLTRNLRVSRFLSQQISSSCLEPLVILPIQRVCQSVLAWTSFYLRLALVSQPTSAPGQYRQSLSGYCVTDLLPLQIEW